MKRLIALAIAAALCLPLSGASAWWQSIQQVGVVSAPSGPSLGDNQVVATSASVTSQSLTVTTTTANELIVVLAGQQSAAVGSVSDNIGLTWTARGAANRFSSQFSNQYWAKAVSPGPYTITVTYAGTAQFDSVVNAITIKGANASVPFDTNAALPDLVGNSAGSHGPGQQANLTTTATVTFAYCFYVYDSISTPLPGSGWTQLQSGSLFLSQYKTFSSPQTATACGQGSTATDIDTGIADAVKP